MSRRGSFWGSCGRCSRRVQERGAAVKQKEAELAKREQAARGAAQRIEEQIKELTKLRDELERKITASRDGKAAERPKEEPKEVVEAEAKDRKKGLTERARRVSQMVGSMPPPRAATLLSAFKDDELAVMAHPVAAAGAGRQGAGPDAPRGGGPPDRAGLPERRRIQGEP